VPLDAPAPAIASAEDLYDLLTRALRALPVSVDVAPVSAGLTDVYSERSRSSLALAAMSPGPFERVFGDQERRCAR
jgi:hypothetical protein